MEALKIDSFREAAVPHPTAYPKNILFKSEGGGGISSPLGSNYKIPLQSMLQYYERSAQNLGVNKPVAACKRNPYNIYILCGLK